MKQETVVIAIGGTGGHVIPGQYVGEDLSKDARVIYMGVNLDSNSFLKDMECEVVEIAGSSLSKGPIRCMKENGKGFWEARTYLKRERVDRVIGLGSYHSLPVVLAAIYLGIEVHLIELNVISGRVNKLFSRWSTKNFVTFEPCLGHMKGNTKVISLDSVSNSKTRVVEMKTARRLLGLKEGIPVLFLVGGSTGARGMDDLFLAALKKGDQIQVIHITPDVDEVTRVYKNLQIPAVIFKFIDEVENAWCAADLVISRSGAGALRDMITFEKPALLIPYPWATRDHQFHNAKFICDRVKGGKYVHQGDLDGKRLRKRIFALLKEKELEKMKDALVNYAKANQHPSMKGILKGES